MRLEKFNFGVSLFWGRALGKSSTFVSIFVLRQFLVFIINHSFKGHTLVAAACLLLLAWCLYPYVIALPVGFAAEKSSLCAVPRLLLTKSPSTGGAGCAMVIPPKII